MKINRIAKLGVAVTTVASALMAGCPGEEANDGGILSGRWTTEFATQQSQDVFLTQKLTYTFEAENDVTVELIQEAVRGTTVTEIVDTFTGTFTASAVDGPEDATAKAQRAGIITFNTSVQTPVANTTYTAFLRAVDPDLSNDEAEIALDYLQHDGPEPFEFPQGVDLEAQLRIQEAAFSVILTEEIKAMAMGCGEEGPCALTYEYEPHFDVMSIGDFTTLWRE